MRSIPGIGLRRSRAAGAKVLCPAGCGTVVHQLRASQAIRPGFMATGAVEGECPKCGEAFRIPVIEE